MDEHNSLRQPPCPEKGLVDKGTIPSISVLTHIHQTKEKEINSQIMTRCYIVAISLRTIGETKILSLTPHGGVANTTFIPPLKHLQRLGKGNICIYTSTSRPTKVQNSNSETDILALRLSFLSQYLTSPSEALWQAPHWCSFLFLYPFVLAGSLDGIGQTSYWTILLTEDFSIINSLYKTHKSTTFNLNIKIVIIVVTQYKMQASFLSYSHSQRIGLNRTTMLELGKFH